MEESLNKRNRSRLCFKATVSAPVYAAIEIGSPSRMWEHMPVIAALSEAEARGPENSLPVMYLV